MCFVLCSFLIVLWVRFYAYVIVVWSMLCLCHHCFCPFVFSRFSYFLFSVGFSPGRRSACVFLFLFLFHFLQFSPGRGTACVFSFWSALRLCNSVFGALSVSFCCIFFLSFPGQGTACFLLSLYCDLQVLLGFLSFFLVGLFGTGGWLYCLCFDLLLLLLAFIVISWVSRARGLLVDFGGVLFVLVIVIHQF